MAEPIWWELEGSPARIRKLNRVLTKDRHYVVRDSRTNLFLRIQPEEKRFVTKICKGHDVTAKEANAPNYDYTPCGKFATHPKIHARSCKSCQQLTRNLAMAARSPIAKEPIWVSENTTISKIQMPDVQGGTNSRSGLGAVLQPPQGTGSKESLKAAALEAHATAERLFAQATYYATVAQSYEGLMAPTTAIQEAQMALKAAQAQEEIQRKEQRETLRTLLAEGPPGDD